MDGPQRIATVSWVNGDSVLALGIVPVGMPAVEWGGNDNQSTDWADAKMVPQSAGRFDLDDYIDYLIGFLDHIGPGTHVLAVCQPSVPALAATAVMNAANHRAAPATLTRVCERESCWR